MIVTIVAVLCSHAVCHEEIVSQADGGIGLGCLVAEAQTLKDWKPHSIYSGDHWTITRIKCVAGEYRVKEQT